MSFPDTASSVVFSGFEGLQFRVLRSAQELEALAPAWIALWCRDPHRTPFQRPEWLLPWWRQFGQPGLRVLTVSAGAELLALLPFYIYTDTYADPASQERQLLLLGAGTSDYLDGIFAPECTPAHVLSALTLLRSEPDWDVAQLTQLRAHSPLTQALRGLGPERAIPRAGESCSLCLALPVTQLPGKLRADVRYYLHAAGGRPKVTLAAAGEDAVLEDFETLVQLHTQRWENAGEPGVLADPLVLAWHREALPLLQASGLLRLYVLRREAEVLAVLYALVDPAAAEDGGKAARTAYFYLMGHAAQHASIRPGTLLTALSVEDAAGEGITTIDMLRGNETYKKFWHARPSPTYGFAVARHGLP